MKTKTIEVYTINELTEKAKENAYYKWCEYVDYPWHKENEESYNQIFELIDKCQENDDLKELTGNRAYCWLENNVFWHLRKGKYFCTKGYYDNDKKYQYKSKQSRCQFEFSWSGYYLDNLLIESILNNLKYLVNKRYCLFDIVKFLVDDYQNFVNNDIEHCISMESFIDYSIANEVEYNAFGEII